MNKNVYIALEEGFDSSDWEYHESRVYGVYASHGRAVDIVFTELTDSGFETEYFEKIAKNGKKTSIIKYKKGEMNYTVTIEKYCVQ